MTRGQETPAQPGDLGLGLPLCSWGGLWGVWEDLAPGVPHRFYLGGEETEPKGPWPRGEAQTP